MTNNKDINIDLIIEQGNNESKVSKPPKRRWWMWLILLLLAFCGGFGTAKHHFRDVTQMVDTLVVERWDTITISQPTEVVRYVMRYDTIRDSSITIIVDTNSATPTAIIPIERTIYRDSTENAKYEAFLSGYRAKLDSIYIECLNKETTITITEREKASRWGIGIQAGVGVSAQGIAAPYVGVGIQYRLIGK